jgi:hypothetical protein
LVAIESLNVKEKNFCFKATVASTRVAFLNRQLGWGGVPFEFKKNRLADRLNRPKKLPSTVALPVGTGV